MRTHSAKSPALGRCVPELCCLAWLTGSCIQRCRDDHSPGKDLVGEHAQAPGVHRLAGCGGGSPMRLSIHQLQAHRSQAQCG